MVLSSVYCGGRTVSKSNNGTIFFYCTFNEIYLVHNVLLCFLLTFMELPVRENGRGISQILAGDGRSGPEINKPGRPFRLPQKMKKTKKSRNKRLKNTKTQIPNSLAVAGDRRLGTEIDRHKLALFCLKLQQSKSTKNPEIHL